MIIFKHKGDNKYLITNYKVMFSTLANQPNLERVNNKSFILQKVLEIIKIRSKASVYFLIRHPELRLQSFFTNKFRQHLDKTNFNDWEHCQKIFFEHLGITESDPLQFIKEKILNFTYQQFIQSLPTHYQKDAHVLPQSHMTDLGIMGFTIPIKNRPAQVYLMEKEADLKNLEHTFELNLSIKRNTTNGDPENFVLTPDMKQIIQHIYAEDFKMYAQYS